jgi:hypothetical protein
MLKGYAPMRRRVAPPAPPEQSEVQVMFLPIEVARMVERERRREAERRIPILVAIREEARSQGRTASQGTTAPSPTGPRPVRQTGPGF